MTLGLAVVVVVVLLLRSSSETMHYYANVIDVQNRENKIIFFNYVKMSKDAKTMRLKRYKNISKS